MTSHVIQSNNVNDAFVSALWWLKTAGIKETSRNGPVLVAPGLVVTEYDRPWERVLFDKRRDANPVFHLMEALWMLTGDNDLAWINQFNSRMEKFGENGKQWGAYGWRWREYFGKDQIQLVIDELKRDPKSRRAVISMWDPAEDLEHQGPDLPCNVSIFFDRRGGELNMTVCNRSNDLLWGAYGANVVHMSILQEAIAWELGVPMGMYRQVSDNFHAYTDLPMMADFLKNPPFGADDRYKEHRGEARAVHVPLLSGHETLAMLTEDCKMLVAGGHNFKCHFMQGIAAPLRDAYLARKAGQPYIVPAGNVDWMIAFREWDARRAAK
jgi:Thymidylate synthase